LYKNVGGVSVVDCTPTELRYKPELLPEISKNSNVNIISGCGYYVDQFMSADTKLMSKEEMASTIIQEVTEGIKGTGFRCGVIGEIGCSAPLTDAEMRSLQAAAMAQRVTGNIYTRHVILQYHMKELLLSSTLEGNLSLLLKF